LRRGLALSIIVIVAAATIATSIASERVNGSMGIPIECHSIVLLQSFNVSKSLVVESIELYTPINASLGEIRQRVHTIASSGVVNGSVELRRGERGFFGYLASYVRICYPKGSWMIRQFQLLFADPSLYIQYSVPRNLSKYIGEPEKVIVEVDRAFTEWLYRNGIEFSQLSYASLAIHAAYFIYFVYIRYSPSPIPHSVAQTVKTRRGDCDDMSRVLTEMLWSYAVPAQMAYGLVLINMSRPYRVSFEGLRASFIDAGPHAFVVSYLPPLGWSSLDLLAGSLLTHPFIFIEITMNTHVPKNVSRYMHWLWSHVRMDLAVAAVPRKLFELASTRVGTYLLTELLARYILMASPSRGALYGFLEKLSRAPVYTVYEIELLWSAIPPPHTVYRDIHRPV